MAAHDSRKDVSETSDARSARQHMCSPAAKDMAAALDEADAGEMPPPPPVAKTATSDYTIGEFGLAPPPPPTRAALGADVSTTLEALQTLVRVEEGMPPVWGKSSMFTAQIHAASRCDYVRADTWATQASECARASTGSDSPEYELHASFIGKRPEGWGW